MFMWQIEKSLMERLMIEFVRHCEFLLCVGKGRTRFVNVGYFVVPVFRGDPVFTH